MSIKLTLRIFSLLAVTAMLSAPGSAQDRASPRRIEPDHFPDYGIRSQPSTPLPSPPQAIKLAMPTDAQPLGSCERAMPTAVWLRCLRDTIGLTDAALSAVSGRIKTSFEARDDINDVLRNAWSHAIDESQIRWRVLRDYECQTLAMAEPQAPPELFEARLICTIGRNRARAAQLAARYGVAE